MPDETAALDQTIVEWARHALMVRHSQNWEMETVSNAAHLIAEVSAQTGRAQGAVLADIERVISLFHYDSVRQRALDALREALRRDADANV